MLGNFINVKTTRPKYEVAKVFRQYGAAYRQKYSLSKEQARAMWDIERCRTPS